MSRNYSLHVAWESLPEILWKPDSDRELTCSDNKQSIHSSPLNYLPGPKPCSCLLFHNIETKEKTVCLN